MKIPFKLSFFCNANSNFEPYKQIFSSIYSSIFRKTSKLLLRLFFFFFLNDFLDGPENCLKADKKLNGE